jgi:2,5-dioxopentanoate dehydrogenase
MKLHGCSFIGNQLSSGTGQTFQAISPLDSGPLEPAFYRAGANEVEATLTFAQKAFVKYRKTAGAERGAFLIKIADEIMALGDDLITRAHRETGLIA